MSSKSSAKAPQPRAATCGHRTGARRAAAGGSGEPGELQAGTAEHCSTPTDDAHIVIPAGMGLLPLCSSCRATCRHCSTHSCWLCCSEQTLGLREAPRAALGSEGAHSPTQTFGVGMGPHMSICDPCQEPWGEGMAHGTCLSFCCSRSLSPALENTMSWPAEMAKMNSTPCSWAVLMRDCIWAGDREEGCSETLKAQEGQKGGCSLKDQRERRALGRWCSGPETHRSSVAVGVPGENP